MNPLRSRFEYVLIALFALKMRILPLSFARCISDIFANLVSRLLRIRRSVTLANLKLAFPDSTVNARRKIYHQIWKHFLRVGVEMARLPKLNPKALDKVIDLKQFEVLKTSLEKGKGVIFVSGHLGNWEWMGAGSALLGIPVTYVVEEQANPHVTRWMDDMRRSAGIEIVGRKDAIRGTLSALKRNRAVAMLCDQDAGSAGVFVSFFGSQASTPRGPALFAIKTGAPVVFGTAPFVDGKYRCLFELLDLPKLTGNKEQDEFAIMQLITSKLETEVRKHPGQYLWLHRRWKTQQPSA